MSAARKHKHDNRKTITMKIKIYCTLTEEIDVETLENAISLLPLWRREYAEKKILSERINSTFAYLLLQRLISEQFGLSDTAPFTYGKQGKPYFGNIRLFFSLSHCRTAVAAGACENEIGVDILDNRLLNENIALRICNEAELEKFNRSENKQEFLRQLWCRKESIVKRKGIGFTEGFKTADTEKEDCRVVIKEKYILSVSAEQKGDFEIEAEEIPFKELI